MGRATGPEAGNRPPGINGSDVKAGAAAVDRTDIQRPVHLTATAGATATPKSVGTVGKKPDEAQAPKGTAP